jgi:elongation factor Ts
MQITASLVNELRQKTGAGMMDCKKALVEADGDIQKAIEILRKKGAAVAAKRAEKTTNEGIVLTKVSDDKKNGVIVEVNCETDFVANSDDFVSLANFIVAKLLEEKPADVNTLLAIPAIAEKINEVMGKVGEKIQVTRIAVDYAADGIVVGYIHPGSKLGVLVTIEKVSSGVDEMSALGKDIAMQVAAMKPVCAYREEVPKDLIEKEIEIYKELARKEGKPEAILEKIAAGKLNKYYQENCLVEQAFIKDNARSIIELIKEFNTKHGSAARIVGFRRFHLGDEKK